MGILVIIVVAIVGIGIGLSFYGNQIVFENLKTKVGTITLGKDLIVSSEIGKNSGGGIYAVEIIDYNENLIVHAKVVDPFNSMIESENISVERFEEKFDLTND
ncbi:MAG: hypothetical protein R3321_14965, partial [Nitrososphaeraceae archaeon]|nr:hypothetical protein [Nitrososphaeraceae archaeon]